MQRARGTSPARAGARRRPVLGPGGRREEPLPSPGMLPLLRAADLGARARAVQQVQRQVGNRAVRLVLQRRAGDGPLAPAAQRDPDGSPGAVRAHLVPAETEDDTAAVIWRDEHGSIVALVEFESNAAMTAYTTGRTPLDELLATGRAAVAQQSVALTALPSPPAGTPAGTPAGARAPAGETAERPGAPSRLSEILESAYKQLRTARILAYLASQHRHLEAERAISRLLAEARQLRKKARALGNRISRSGGGAKVAAELARVEAEILRVERLVVEQRAALQAARAAMKAEAAAASGVLARIRQLMGHEGIAKEKAAGRLWQVVGKHLVPRINGLLRLLEASASGAKLLSVLSRLRSPWVTRTLIGAAALLEGVSAYLTTKNRTGAGKIADAALTAGSGALVVANPATALADLFLPKDYKLSTMYRGGSGAITSLGEGLITGDTSAMESFHEASKRGEYGKVMQVSSEAGDYWAEHGVVGGLKSFGRELWDWL
ncbi:hypothetical protein ACH9EU_09465 [Kocuria sp. M1R5S2]|uniref:hypothetical protein n=1 Tax=Kocuria rhizosphaerae TaxID=3376285 RepID=UPI0037B61572